MTPPACVIDISARPRGKRASSKNRSGSKSGAITRASRRDHHRIRIADRNRQPLRYFRNFQQAQYPLSADEPYAGRLSIIDMGPAVGITRFKWKPASCRSARNSASVRSRPPSMTSMFKSASFPSSAWLAGFRTRSMRSSFPLGRIARRQFRRIFNAAVSFQYGRRNSANTRRLLLGPTRKNLRPRLSAKVREREERLKSCNARCAS